MEYINNVDIQSLCEIKTNLMRLFGFFLFILASCTSKTELDLSLNESLLNTANEKLKYYGWTTADIGLPAKFRNLHQQQEWIHKVITELNDEILKDGKISESKAIQIDSIIQFLDSNPVIKDETKKSLSLKLKELKNVNRLDQSTLDLLNNILLNQIKLLDQYYNHFDRSLFHFENIYPLIVPNNPDIKVNEEIEFRVYVAGENRIIPNVYDGKIDTLKNPDIFKNLTPVDYGEENGKYYNILKRKFTKLGLDTINGYFFYNKNGRDFKVKFEKIIEVKK